MSDGIMHSSDYKKYGMEKFDNTLNKMKKQISPLEQARGSLKDQVPEELNRRFENYGREIGKRQLRNEPSKKESLNPKTRKSSGLKKRIISIAMAALTATSVIGTTSAYIQHEKAQELAKEIVNKEFNKQDKTDNEFNETLTQADSIITKEISKAMNSNENTKGIRWRGYDENLNPIIYLDNGEVRKDVYRVKLPDEVYKISEQARKLKQYAILDEEENIIGYLEGKEMGAIDGRDGVNTAIEEYYEKQQENTIPEYEELTNDDDEER